MVLSLMSSLPHYHGLAAEMDSWQTPATIPGLTLLGEDGMGLAVPWQWDILRSDAIESPLLT